MNVLRQIKDAIASNAESLDLSRQGITEIPPDIGDLSSLTGLYLSGNPGIRLPAEIGKLSKLQWLDLAGNDLNDLPLELFQLAQLLSLDLTGNRLTSLPADIGQLKGLAHLYLSKNQLTAIPAQIGEISGLIELDISDNQLASLPVEIGALTKARIDIGNNPFDGLAPELRAQGAEAILAYFRANADESERLWVSKLLVVGQGGVGKTCLLRALRAEKYEEGEETTHGIDIGTLDLPHPTEAGVTMRLNTWDFAGQQINHATHQFFLTNRSLFLLVWNARHEWEQGKLNYWLATIKALAPDSPIMLVATQTDERDARLPIEEIRRGYPQVLGNWPVSSKVGTGIKELQQAIAEAASQLPLMGEPWPVTWLAAAEAVRGLTDQHTSPRKLKELMHDHGVDDKGRDVLARWLHELGDILYFADNRDLDDFVILRPSWVTREISRVLESKDVMMGRGILSRTAMEALWAGLDEGLHDYVLRLMERFDLSYRTLEDRELSLVVERLPLDAPDYSSLWTEDIAVLRGASPGLKTLALRYQLNTIPAGIPTWFIAREHRFTTGTHWFSGAVFAHKLSREQRIALGNPGSEGYGDAVAAAKHGNLAFVRVDRQARCVNLTARGPMPAEFFALMKDGLENMTFQRFPGLEIKRYVPCPGHDDGKPCAGEWDLANLERADENNVEEVQCPERFKMVKLAELLYGVHTGTTLETVLETVKRIEVSVERVDGKADDIISRLDDLILKQREFTSQFRTFQNNPDLCCPNVFLLFHNHPEGRHRKAHRDIIGNDLTLHLCCQQPGEWHPSIKGGRYTIHESPEWLNTIAPYVRALVRVLQIAAPLVAPITGIIDKATADLFADQIKLMEELVKDLPDVKQEGDPDLPDPQNVRQPQTVQGARLRALRKLLDQVDSSQNWGGLVKFQTKEGHILWLCEKHRDQYRD